ncbi:MAG: hypothetical protein JNK82_24580 [Myxococcaceae bacterium]|nr:hypothetical protein [Myxococcaceae bacterium]
MTLLDEETPSPDPLAGTRVGSCEVVGSLLPGKPSALLAFKLDLTGNSETVLLHKLDDKSQPPPAAVADAEEAVGLKDSHLEKTFGIESSELGSFWVTEYVAGATLDEIRATGKERGMPMPMGFGLGAVADAALGLQQLHAKQNVKDPLRPRAHGLLRPQHIVATFGGSAKLLNPRYLKLPHSSTSADGEWMAGNAGYLSPESIRGEPVTPRSDVFSLAVLAHELLTNKVLFSGRNPRERADATLKGAQVPPSRLNFSLSPQVDEAIMKALSLDPIQRYANAGDFHRALRSAVGPYIWKEAQRAEYMERIFATRSRRTKELLVRMKEREAAAIAQAEAERQAAAQRAAEEAAARAAEEEAARVAAQRQADAAAKAAADAAAAAAKAAKAAKKAKPLPVALIAAAGGGAVLIVGILGFVLLGADPPPPPPDPKPIVTPPPVVAPAEVADAGADEADAGTEDGGTDVADAGEVPDAGPPKKKKKKNEVPLPPWLRK